MIEYILNLKSKDFDYEVFINKENDIYIGERSVSMGNFIVIPLEDWPEVKKYIDGLYEEYKSEID